MKRPILAMEIKKPVEAFPIVWPQDESFEVARIGRVFNHRRPARCPVAVVKASSENDVKNAIHTAKKLNCKVSVRSGGHSWAAWSVRDNAVLIDLAEFNSISFDDATGILKVGPAVTGEILNSFLATKHRMFNGPHCPTVGLGGFLY
jgi:FAD/FMN-containing dehydrogenase